MDEGVGSVGQIVCRTHDAIRFAEGNALSRIGRIGGMNGRIGPGRGHGSGTAAERRKSLV